MVPIRDLWWCSLTMCDIHILSSHAYAIGAMVVGLLQTSYSLFSRIRYRSYGGWVAPNILFPLLTHTL